MRLIRYITTFNPRWVISLLSVSVIVVNLIQARWVSGGVIVGEVRRSYAYLPAFFYENDLSFDFLVQADQVKTSHYPPVKTPEEKSWEPPSIGMAISYLPFFALAHLAAEAGGNETDGFSSPYQFAVMFSSLVYFVIGLIFLSKLLRLHFPGFTCSIALVVLCFGTNCFYYLTSGAGMSHPVSFMLCVLFIYQVVSWHQMRDTASAAQLGLLLGALWLVRPVNLLLIIVFLLYDVRRWREVKARGRLLLRKGGQLALTATCCLVVMLPQFLYWKWQTGSFLFNVLSGDGFHFTQPHVLQGLFSFHKGWLIYTPVMIFALAGFFFLRGALRMYAWAVPMFFVIYIYFVFSWWCWWYGDSFGQRALIDIYPLLVIPLAAFIYKMRRLGGVYRHAMFIVLTLVVLLNLFLTYQANHRPVHSNTSICGDYHQIVRPEALSSSF